MTREQLLQAQPGIVALIREQGEKRLECQNSFADALDGKGGTLLTAATSLAAASAAVAAGTLGFDEPVTPLLVAGSVATLLFSASAGLAAWSLRSTGFHSVGWYPQDFAADLENRLSSAEVEADFVLALQERLSENRPILSRRGDRQNWAGYLLLAAPFIASVLALLFA